MKLKPIIVMGILAGLLCFAAQGLAAGQAPAQTEAKPKPQMTMKLVWAQEEPQNMGAWHFVRGHFLDGAVEEVGPGRPLRYVGRPRLASPAPGSHHAFEDEQRALVAEALRAPAPARAEM